MVMFDTFSGRPFEESVSYSVLCGVCAVAVSVAVTVAVAVHVWLWLWLRSCAVGVSCSVVVCCGVPLLSQRILFTSVERLWSAITFRVSGFSLACCGVLGYPTALIVVARV